MVKIIILTREGEVIFEEVESTILTEFSKQSVFQLNIQDLDELYILNDSDYQLKLLGSSNQYIFKENVHEFQRPLDTTIFVGHLILIKISKKLNEIIDINNSDCQKIVNIQN